MEINTIIEKIKSNIFLIPEDRFDKLTKDASYKDSFVYLLACLAISFPINLIVALVFGGSSILSVFFQLIIAVPLSYISYAVTHLFIKLLGGKENLFKSVQILIYGETPAIIFGGIPLLGLIFALVALANVVLGTKRIHNMPLWKAIVAIVVLPIIVIIVVAFLLAAFIASTYALVPGLRV